jgi:hypothetical protein
LAATTRPPQITSRDLVLFMAGLKRDRRGDRNPLGLEARAET